MRKIVLLLSFSLVALIVAFTPILSAQAATCRQTSAHRVCILSIERSAKNHWEYRAAVEVDHVKRPIAVYNCRGRVRVKQDGTVVPFEIGGAGDVICRLLQR